MPTRPLSGASRSCRPNGKLPVRLYLPASRAQLVLFSRGSQFISRQTGKLVCRAEPKVTSAGNALYVQLKWNCIDDSLNAVSEQHPESLRGASPDCRNRSRNVDRVESLPQWEDVFILKSLIRRYFSLAVAEAGSIVWVGLPPKRHACRHLFLFVRV